MLHRLRASHHMDEGFAGLITYAWSEYARQAGGCRRDRRVQADADRASCGGLPAPRQQRRGNNDRRAAGYRKPPFTLLFGVALEQTRSSLLIDAIRKY
ncbi:MAG: hypothetical protein WA397_21865 [Roseiarcus sp.]